ncbi:MAG TPA: MFS transporter [Rhodanobacteraceae bacterium]|nr:MFS transporter [Rhodanobacteraceae bacterium]
MSARRTWAMWAAALGIAALYVGSTILTPLYPVYERELGFTELVVTEIYAIYVVGNLAVLFFFGRLSDGIGRRVTTLIALAITVASAVCFLLARGTAWLFAARVLNGFAAGLGAGALTAWIAELEPAGDRARAATYASGGNLLGLAFGALGAGLLAQHAPSPLRLCFACYAVLLVIVGALLAFVPETVERRVRSVRDLSLRPRIGIPSGIRVPFIAPAAMAFAAFALGGFFAALAPGLLTRRLGETDLSIVGAIVALFFGVASATAAATQRLDSRKALFSASALVLVGLALLLVADGARSMPVLIAAAVATGAAMALGYRSSLEIVNAIAPGERRAEVVSSYLLVCYSANAIPVIGVGLLALVVSPENAHRVFAAVLAALALLACAIAARHLKR